MDQRSQPSVDEGAMYGNNPALYDLTTFQQPIPLASVPPSSASQTLPTHSLPHGLFRPIPALAYQAAILPPLSNQQPSQTNAIEAAKHGDTAASYTLTTYSHQPVPLDSVPPSSAAGSTFPPVPASQGGAGAYPSAIPPLLSDQHQAAFQKLQQQQHQQLQQQHEQLQAFWVGQLAEAEQATELKAHSLPLARIKKIMKADEDVKMIAAEAPVVFAKACEMFILELTLRSWLHTEGTNRRTLQRSDVAAAITANEMFDFLMDVAPVEERRGDGVLPPPPTTPLSYGPGPAMSASFPTYANQQPMQFMWPPPEFQQQQQQNPDEGQDE